MRCLGEGLVRILSRSSFTTPSCKRQAREPSFQTLQKKFYLVIDFRYNRDILLLCQVQKLSNYPSLPARDAVMLGILEYQQYRKPALRAGAVFGIKTKSSDRSVEMSTGGSYPNTKNRVNEAYRLVGELGTTSPLYSNPG